MKPIFDKMSGEKLVRVNVAARRLCRSTRTIRRLIQLGQLPAQRINRRSWGIRASDISELLARLEGE